MMHDSKSHLWQVWHSMKCRCLVPSAGSYKNYGAKGITVCADWLLFWKFRLWALENGYNERLSLERKENCKGYTPENCCWIPFYLQNRNKTNHKFVTGFGETKPLFKWMEDTRCKTKSYNAVYARLSKGWSLEEAIVTPTKKEIITWPI